VSLEVGVFASLLGFSVGGSLGMLTAYRRNGVSKAISLVMLTMLAFPAFLATIAILSFWQPTTSLLHVIVVVGVFSIPLVFRVTQAATLSAATKDFVLAAKVQGATDRRIVFRELLPNVAPTILSFFLFAIATIIGIEGALSFLGFSVQSSVGPSWGNMLNESRTYLETSPGLAIWTCINLSLFLVALNFIGERLRSYFDVTEVKL
jgi:peptide/nickel transport system permease protein